MFHKHIHYPILVILRPALRIISNNEKMFPKIRTEGILKVGLGLELIRKREYTVAIKTRNQIVLGRVA